MNLAITVGIIGSLTGLAAGLAGTYLAVASSVGPREKTFMVRGALVCWVGVGLLVAARFLLPGPVPIMPLLGTLLLFPALRWWSERQVEIREAEREERVQQLRAVAAERR
jgi:hypothetical protein